jgi:hypothetical protein
MDLVIDVTLGLAMIGSFIVFSVFVDRYIGLP